MIRWLGYFNGISAFNNSGMSLLDANMVSSLLRMVLWSLKSANLRSKDSLPNISLPADADGFYDLSRKHGVSGPGAVYEFH